MPNRVNVEPYKFPHDVWNGLNEADSSLSLQRKTPRGFFDGVERAVTDIGVKRFETDLIVRKGSWSIWHGENVTIPNPFASPIEPRSAAIGLGLYKAEGSEITSHLLWRVNRPQEFTVKEFLDAASVVSNDVINRPDHMLRASVIGATVGGVLGAALGSVSGESGIIGIAGVAGTAIGGVYGGIYEMGVSGKYAQNIPDVVDYKVDDVGAQQLKDLADHVNSTRTLLELGERLPEDASVGIREIAGFLKENGDMQRGSAMRLVERRRGWAAESSQTLDVMMRMVMVHERAIKSQGLGRVELESIAQELKLVNIEQNIFRASQS